MVLKEPPKSDETREDLIESSTWLPRHATPWRCERVKPWRKFLHKRVYNRVTFRLTLQFTSLSERARLHNSLKAILPAIHESNRKLGKELGVRKSSAAQRSLQARPQRARYLFSSQHDDNDYLRPGQLTILCKQQCDIKSFMGVTSSNYIAKNVSCIFPCFSISEEKGLHWIFSPRTEREKKNVETHTFRQLFVVKNPI